MTFFTRRDALIALAAGPGFALAAADAGSAALTAVVERAYRPLLTRHGVTGMAVAVTAGGRSRFFNFGRLSKAPHAPAVTQDTLFELGSVSKTVTATLACCAEVLGKLALDDHPGRYLPALSGAPIDRATLLHLGTYTAGGLPLQFPDAVTDERGMLDYFRRWQPTAAPGAVRRYSNPSIGLLGRITAIAMDAEYTDIVERTLLPGLGLLRTHIRVPASEMGRYAWGYDGHDRPVRVNPGVLDAETYGIKSTAADMLRFVELQLRPQQLEAPLRDAVERTHLGHMAVGGMVQGLGWEQYPYPVALARLQSGNSPAMLFEDRPATAITPPRAAAGPTLYNKTGSTNGFGAYVAFVPERGVGIVMLANRSVPIDARVGAAHAVLRHLTQRPR